MTTPIHPYLDALATATGLTGLTLDAEGLRSLAVGEGLVINLQHDAAADEIVLFAVVGTVPPSAPPSLLADLLRANRFWRGTGGATLSLDEQEPPRVILARRVNLLASTPAQWVAAFERFADHLQDWAGRVQGEGAAEVPGGMRPGQFA